MVLGIQNTATKEQKLRETPQATLSQLFPQVQSKTNMKTNLRLFQLVLFLYSGQDFRHICFQDHPSHAEFSQDVVDLTHTKRFQWE